MEKVIDFDELFNKYFEKWYRANRAKYESADDMEAAMPEVYAAFLKESNDALGVSPAAYFSDRSAEDLVALLKTYLAEHVPVPDLLLETLVRKPGAESALYAALTESRSAELTAMLMNMLDDLGSSMPYGLYADWVLNTAVEASVRELAVELLAAREAGVAFAKDRLLTAAASADEETRLMIADVVVNAAGDERAYRLLTDLFLTGADLALTASYLGKFGDERALPLLQDAIRREDIDYAEFIELRNAIERLGGTVETSRSFENDPTYHALKGLN